MQWWQQETNDKGEILDNCLLVIKIASYQCPKFHSKKIFYASFYQDGDTLYMYNDCNASESSMSILRFI